MRPDGRPAPHLRRSERVTAYERLRSTMDDDALYELTHDPALRPDYETAIHDVHSELRVAHLAGQGRRLS